MNVFFYVHINLVVYVGMYVHMYEGTNGWINRPRGGGRVTWTTQDVLYHDPILLRPFIAEAKQLNSMRSISIRFAFRLCKVLCLTSLLSFQEIPNFLKEKTSIMLWAQGFGRA